MKTLDIPEEIKNLANEYTGDRMTHETNFVNIIVNTLDVRIPEVIRIIENSDMSAEDKAVRIIYFRSFKSLLEQASELWPVFILEACAKERLFKACSRSEKVARFNEKLRNLKKVRSWKRKHWKYREFLIEQSTKVLGMIDQCMYRESFIDEKEYHWPTDGCGPYLCNQIIRRCFLQYFKRHACERSHRKSLIKEKAND